MGVWCAWSGVGRQVFYHRSAIQKAASILREPAAALGTDLPDIAFLSQTFQEIIESSAYFSQLIVRLSSDFRTA